MADIKHCCHATDCTEEIPRKRFVCVRHWRMLPRHLQKRIYETYQPGQEDGLVKPSVEYMAVAMWARAHISRAESATKASERSTRAQVPLFGQ